MTGVIALAVQHLLRPTPLPPSGEYFLTELARGQIGPISIVVAVAAAFALGYYVQAHPALVGLGMLAIFPIIALYEATRYRGSHNLLPFEIAIVATWAIPLILAAWGGRRLAQSPGSRAARGGGTDSP